MRLPTLVEVRSKFTIYRPALNRRNHRVSDHKAPDVRAPRFLDKFLDQDVRFELSEGVDDRTCSRVRFDQHDAHALRAFKELVA